MHPLEQLMKSVVRIEVQLADGSVATGSGFAYHFAIRSDGLNIPTIVTNKHVVKDAVSITFPISVADKSGNPTGTFEFFKFDLGKGFILYHPDINVDLCAIPIAPMYQYFEQKGLQPLLVHLDKDIIANTATFSDLLPLEEVTMIGFPNGLWDSKNNGSIARRGVIATMPEHDYLGKKQFVIDMACFPGSSGSPVFLANFGNYADRQGNLIMGTRIKLLGVLYAGPQHTASGEIILAPVPTKSKPMSLTSMPNNLGYVIKSMELGPLELMAEKLHSDSIS